MMKLKLRKLRKKREETRHFKGGFPISIPDDDSTLKIKRRADGVRLRGDFFAKYRHIDRLRRYLTLNLIPKAKKRGGKNR